MKWIFFLLYNIFSFSHIVEFWQILCTDLDLSGTIIENFLTLLGSSCLYEHDDGNDSTRQKIATLQPFAIICVLRVMFKTEGLTNELKSKFSDIITMLITSLASYTNVAPPIVTSKVATQTIPRSNSKFSFIPNKETVKMNPCLIVIETFISFLERLNMEQVRITF